MSIICLRQGNELRFANGDIAPSIDAGVYNVDVDDRTGEKYLIVKQVESEGLVALPNSTAEDIAVKVDRFLQDAVKKKFETYKLLYKRGLLMYGPPGTGKTAIINQLTTVAIKKDMIVLLDPRPAWLTGIVPLIRSISPEKSILVIWEEFEEWVDDYESAILNVLDGMTQISNIFYVATTNYIDKIPPRIRNRPSRFADIIKVGIPSAEGRKAFLKNKIIPTDEIDIDDWVKKTDGFVIDQLKDLIISVLVLEISLDDAIEKLKSIENLETDEDEKKSSEEIDKVEPSAAL